VFSVSVKKYRKTESPTGQRYILFNFICNFSIYIYIHFLCVQVEVLKKSIKRKKKLWSRKHKHFFFFEEKTQTLLQVCYIQISSIMFSLSFFISTHVFALVLITHFLEFLLYSLYIFFVLITHLLYYDLYMMWLL